jgi:hypothetical protein
MNHLSSFTQFLTESKINESTDLIGSSNGNLIIVSDYVKSHIKEHNELGIGSIFRKGITEGEILSMVGRIKNEVNPSQSAYQIRVPRIGYNLVLPYEEAMALEGAVESTTEKKEGPNTVIVPLVQTIQDLEDFVTDDITLIVRPSNPQFLPEDVKMDSEVMSKIEEGKCYSLLTAFPGDPDIPKASEWKGMFAVVVPTF